MPELQLSLQMPDARHRGQLPRHRVARWIRAALQAPADITVRIVDEDEGRALNRDYRGKDYATNVLSFPGEMPEGVKLPKGVTLPRGAISVMVPPGRACRAAARATCRPDRPASSGGTGSSAPPTRRWPEHRS